MISVKGPYEGANGQTWDIETDLDPQTVTAVGRAIYKAWIDFAMGRAALGGKTLMHPTGKYASSIQFAQTGTAKVAIMALETLGNPEANILEVGHVKIDLKEYFRRGQVVPMLRGGKSGVSSGGYEWEGAGYGKPTRNMSAFAKRKNIWASVRKQGSTGFARVGTTGWIIPAMPAYSPAAHLVDLFASGGLAGV